LRAGSPGKTKTEQRHLNMSHIKSDNTAIEIALRKALWRAGIRYRKNYKALPGKPDIVITKYRIAIFCDGEFWHGKNWEIKKTQIQSNREYWLAKIEKNIDRDNIVDWQLHNQGWVVMRFWGEEIRKNLAACVEDIEEAIIQARMDFCDSYSRMCEIEEERKPDILRPIVVI